MTSDERARFKDKLEQLRDALEGRGRIRLDPNRTDDAERPDDDFQALNEMHQAIASGRNRNQTVVLAQVKEALETIEADPEDFGLCQECEESIPMGRLELMPYAPLCVRCQSAQEAPTGPGGRRKITDYTG